MSELSSPGKVTSASGSANLTSAGLQVKNYETRNVYQASVTAEQRSKTSEEGAKLPVRNVQGDTFSTANPSAKPPASENINATRITVMQENLRTEQQMVLNTIVNAGINAREILNNFMSRFVNIMDKISAIFGEREKDIREKLSDTLKNFEQKLYNFLGRVDTSMEHHDSKQEKQKKENEQEDSEQEHEEASG